MDAGMSLVKDTMQRLHLTPCLANIAARLASPDSDDTTESLGDHSN